MTTIAVALAAINELPALLTREELAARWKKHVCSVDRMISSGALKAIRVGGAVRIPRAEVARIESL
ncbi:MAG: hypothetical protein DPW14_09605 [Planctomycetes bacterium]|nr:hypothetical protein [Planctomycetota bacterium]